MAKELVAQANPEDRQGGVGQNQGAGNANVRLVLRVARTWRQQDAPEGPHIHPGIKRPHNGHRSPDLLQHVHQVHGKTIVVVHHQHPGPPPERLVRPRRHQLAGSAHDLKGAADHDHLRPLAGLGEGHLQRRAVGAPAQGPPAGLGDVRGEPAELRGHFGYGLVAGGAEDDCDAVGGKLGPHGSAEGCDPRGVVGGIKDIPSSIIVCVHLKPARRRLHLLYRLPTHQRQDQSRQPQGRVPVQLALHLREPCYRRSPDFRCHAV
mmetsp:Transcript_59277/g.136866  ORF Transcript_59277/g.136866 Transcript_59277/m.136866 type:complete len:263 (+) Transcript_59277:2833-3621(+)